jgi:ElaB/YqjD/DUF883 family membrane-anchored ribosome-binding protein
MNDGIMTKPLVTTHSNGGVADKSRSLHDTATDLHSKGTEKLETLQDKVVEVKDKVIEVKDKIVDRGGATAEKLRSFARAHPLKTIAIAFALGFIGMRVTRPLRWL